MKLTQAEEVAREFGDDGQRTTADDGATLFEACEYAGARRVRFCDRMDVVKHVFPDGSAIVECGGFWDLALDPGDDDCHCWEGNHEHSANCPVALAEGVANSLGR